MYVHTFQYHYISLCTFMPNKFISSSLTIVIDSTVTCRRGKKMKPMFLFSVVLVFALFLNCIHVCSSQVPGNCRERCGRFSVPFPFYLNNSCSSNISIDFHLTCSNSSTLLLNIGSENYTVLDFFPDGVLVDFPGKYCRQYNDLNSFGKSFGGNEYFGISADNVIGLYDCEDSSLCKADCETVVLPGCDGSETSYPACCYPLTDHSIWHLRDGFSVFSKFGCRGFSSWVVARGANSGKRGVKLEWAIPRNSSLEVCAGNADIINSTAIEKGVRCMCQDGYIGDGFTNGTGCLKSCIKDGREAYGSDCYRKNKRDKTFTIIAGVIGPLFVLASLIALFHLLKRPVKPSTFDIEKAGFDTGISFRKACRTRLFSHQELEEATKYFAEDKKLVEGRNGAIFAGVLGDGSHIAVHRLQCENEKDLMQVLSQTEVLSCIAHKHIARVIGCCIDYGYSPLVVYEFPANGTLEHHLHQTKGHKICLDWFRRLEIGAEIASLLAYLQYEISPPMYHHNLKSGYIFLDEDLSIKFSGFGLTIHGIYGEGSHFYKEKEGPRFHKNDVYDMGVLLLEIISGSNQLDMPAVALQKIRNGKLEEIVDPLLYYHEQPTFRRDQIAIVADLATRCLLFGADGKLGMIDVAKELVHIVRESLDGNSKRGPVLEETFSNSSLLQMISMSPDSMYVS